MKWSAAIRIVFILYSLFHLSCSSDSELEKDRDCRLVSSVTRNTPEINNSTLIEKTQAKYSNDGKLLEILLTLIRNDNVGNLREKEESKSSYKYNEEGLLTETISTWDRVFPSFENISSSVSQYQYQNGLLVESKIHRIYNLFELQSETTSVHTYIYDEDGNLIEDTYSSNNQDTTRTRKTFYAWKNNKIEKITYVNFDGIESVPEIKTNDKGLIIQYKSGESEERCEYDHEANVIRSESWSNGKLTHYDTFVYDSKNIPRKSIDIEPPTYMVKMYGNRIPTRNILKRERFYLDLKGNQRDVDAYVWKHKYNAAGFPIESIISNFYQGETYNVYHEYIYDDCK